MVPKNAKGTASVPQSSNGVSFDNSFGAAWFWGLLSKSDKRSAVSCKHLESAVTDAVKSALDCEAFVGVIIQRIAPKSRTDPNWAVRGARFGKADRDKSGKVLAVVVEQMQRE